MAEFAVKAVKSHAVSADGQKITLTFSGRYFPEVSLALPPDSIDGLIGALTEVKAVLGAQTKTQAAPLVAPDPPGPKDNQVSIRRPKSWMVAADTKTNKLVVMVFDFKTATQSGFGLDPKGARELAAALVKNADAVVAAPGAKDKA